MVKIALISDSHGHLDTKVLSYLQEVDEVWHAGDIGELHLSQVLPKGKKLRIITGNIDGSEMRARYPEELLFELEGLKVFMLHIGGKPPRYAKGVKEKIIKNEVGLFVCGHSHICKVEFDPSLNCLYMNSGAIGQQGFHIMRTLLLFEVQEGKIQNLRIVELGKRGVF